MTTLLDDPAMGDGPATGTEPAPQAAGLGEVLPAGMAAAVRAAAIGLAAVLLLPLLGLLAASVDVARIAPAARLVGQVWLLGHGAGLDIPGGRFEVVPLGLTMLFGWVLYRSGRQAARRTGVRTSVEAVQLTAALAATYASLAAAVAVASAAPTLSAGLFTSAFTGGLLATLAGGAGSLRAAGRLPATVRRLPLRVRAVARAAAAAVALYLAGGAVLGAAALTLSFPVVAQGVAALEPGAPAGAALVLGSAALVPDAAVWSAAYLAGPGFVVGEGTAVTVRTVEVGALPALPLLLAVPSTLPSQGFLLLQAGLWLVAGAVAAGCLRRSLPPAGWRSMAVDAGATAGAAGLMFAVVAALTSGPAGPGRLERFGPDPIAAGLALTAEVGLGLAAATYLRLRWPSRGRSVGPSMFSRLGALARPGSGTTPDTSASARP
ncbi:MAG: DUF6350 family protein [Actinomycetota bacterium]|nr:DUF6350 family protein [Actinomycetota bacterium]